MLDEEFGFELVQREFDEDENHKVADCGQNNYTQRRVVFHFEVIRIEQVQNSGKGPRKWSVVHQVVTKRRFSGQIVARNVAQTKIALKLLQFHESPPNRLFFRFWEENPFLRLLLYTFKKQF